METWSKSLEEGDFKNHGQGWPIKSNIAVAFVFWRVNVVKFLPVSLLIDKLLPLIVKWEWGTMANFLYQYQGKRVDLVIITASRYKSKEIV